MPGHVLIGPADARLVAARGGDARLEIVADDLSRHAAEAGKGAHMTTDPVRQGLRPARLGIGEVGGAQGGDEDLRLPNFAGVGVDHLHGLAGKIDEQALSGGMRLTNRGR